VCFKVVKGDAVWLLGGQKGIKGSEELSDIHNQQKFVV
jgi:hypothetical protein